MCCSVREERSLARYLATSSSRLLTVKLPARAEDSVLQLLARSILAADWSVDRILSCDWLAGTVPCWSSSTSPTPT